MNSHLLLKWLRELEFRRQKEGHFEIKFAVNRIDGLKIDRLWQWREN